MELEAIGTPGLWVAFTVFVLAVLALDLGVFQRRAHVVTAREALTWTGVWIALALAFAVGLYLRFGSERSLDFLTGYIVEKSLSVDNLFIFVMVFSAFRVPPQLQQRVLLWGVGGALVLRGVFIFVGAAALHRFHFIIYVFGAFLVFTGIKVLLQRDAGAPLEANFLTRVLSKWIPFVNRYEGARFTVVESGKRYATPLLMALVTIEASDVVFAADSIPAVFAITTDPFIVFTSNIFAILGMRALYFALASMMAKFHRLKIGLSCVLIFIGGKMLVSPVYEIPIVFALVVIVLILASAVGASLLWPTRSASLVASRPALPTARSAIRTALPLIFAILAVVLCFSSALAFSHFRMRPLERKVDDIIERSVPSIESLSTARAALLRIGMSVSNRDHALSLSPHRAQVVSAQAGLQEALAAYASLPRGLDTFDAATDLVGHLALLDLSVAASLEDADDTGASLVFRQRLADLDHALEAIIAADTRHTRETTASILEDKRDAAAIAIFFGGVSVFVAVSLGILTLLVLRSRTRLVEAHDRLLADRASELEAYAGRVAHDLRTPLAAMMLRVSVAQAREPVEATTLDTRVEPLPTLHVACTLARSAPEILVQPERSVLS